VHPDRCNGGRAVSRAEQVANLVVGTSPQARGGLHNRQGAVLAVRVSPRGCERKTGTDHGGRWWRMPTCAVDGAFATNAHVRPTHATKAPRWTRLREAQPQGSLPNAASPLHAPAPGWRESDRPAPGASDSKRRRAGARLPSAPIGVLIGPQRRTQAIRFGSTTASTGCLSSRVSQGTTLRRLPSPEKGVWTRFERFELSIREMISSATPRRSVCASIASRTAPAGSLKRRGRHRTQPPAGDGSLSGFLAGIVA
jgi:hypothetical protein